MIDETKCIYCGKKGAMDRQTPYAEKKRMCKSCHSNIWRDFDEACETRFSIEDAQEIWTEDGM